MTSQMIIVGCHGCGAREEGVASDRPMALHAVDDWKTEHKKTCGGPTWSIVSRAKPAASDQPPSDSPVPEEGRGPRTRRAGAAG